MNDRGFSLIETIVAVSLVALAIGTLAQLFAMSTRANADARRTTLATVLASQKMEQLRRAAAALDPSAPDALNQNVPGYCDFLDEYGRPVEGDVNADAVPPGATVYIRRWSISSLSTASSGALLLQVTVRHAGPGARTGWGDARQADERLFGGAYLVTVKSREVA